MYISKVICLGDNMNFTHVEFDYDFKDIKTINIDEKRHYIISDEHQFPSVTTITGSLPSKVDGLATWQNRVGVREANRIRVQSARRGTRVHEMVERYLNNSGNGQFPDPLAIEMFNSIKPVLDESVNNIYTQEVPLYSMELEIAGRVDCVAEYDGVLSIIDFKTSRKFKKPEWIPDYFMQTCAYATMWEEMTGMYIPQIVIIIAVEKLDSYGTCIGINEPQVFIEPDYKKWYEDLVNLRESFRIKAFLN